MNKKIINKLKCSNRIIDMGCGNNPIPEATDAIDFYLEPKHRSNGDGNNIDVENIRKNGVNFVKCSIDNILPFKDKEFDFAYSHHVFEHIDYPDIACREMIRIAKSGVIITPSYFSEIIFGRSYHKWIIIERNKKLLFLKKRCFEDRRFGEHPLWDENNKKWISNEYTNPFDIILNDGEWYNGNEKMDRLSSKIREYYYKNDPLMETTFIWEDDFLWEIYE